MFRIGKIKEMENIGRGKVKETGKSSPEGRGNRCHQREGGEKIRQTLLP